MAKQQNNKKKTTNKNNSKKTVKTSNKKINDKILKEQKSEKKKFFLMFMVIFFLGVLLIFSAYAWFSTALNVRIKTFNVIVTRNSGISISFDAITFSSSIEISEDTLINNLGNTYPNHLSQWSAGGLTPVSSPGIPHANTYFFDIFSSSGVKYKNRKKEVGYLTTGLAKETTPRTFSNFIAFDIFIKNETGSPVDDNLYLEYGTEIVMESDSGEEMEGLVNSTRIGIAKVGTADLKTNPTIIQNLQCNNQCSSIIYEPNNTLHTELSIERSEKYGINLVDGEPFPTYSYIRAGGPFKVPDTISGSANLDPRYFRLQQTITDEDFVRPIFSLPNGITKFRIYVWIEGQDIDSLETDSDGAEIAISINFIKDTQGYNAFN